MCLKHIERGAFRWLIHYLVAEGCIYWYCKSVFSMVDGFGPGGSEVIKTRAKIILVSEVIVMLMVGQWSCEETSASGWMRCGEGISRS